MGRIRFNAKSASGLLCSFSVFIDGEKVGNIKQNSSEIFEIGNGKHIFQIKDSGAFSKSREYEFLVNNDEIISYNISYNGFKYMVASDDSNQASIDNKKMILCSKLTTELSDLISSVEETGEKVLIAIRGAFREYLICTNKNVYIVKKGFICNIQLN